MDYWELVNQLQKEYEIKIFTWMWKKRLKDAYGYDAKVIEVRGWKTALVDSSYGGRQTITFLIKLKIGKWTFYI